MINNPAAALVVDSYVKTIDDDMDGAAGDLAVTGVGFQPRALIAVMSKPATTNTSVGYCDKDLNVHCLRTNDAGSTTCTTFFYDFYTAAAARWTAIVKSLDADGFTLTRVETNNPTGTIYVRVLCLR